MQGIQRLSSGPSSPCPGRSAGTWRGCSPVGLLQLKEWTGGEEPVRAAVLPQPPAWPPPPPTARDARDIGSKSSEEPESLGVASLGTGADQVATQAHP